MNLPNALTLLRIFFVPLLVAVLVQGHVTFDLEVTTVTSEILALSLFLAAAVTDLLDGYLARKWGQITTVGTLLDPIADKLLVSAASSPSPAFVVLRRRKDTSFRPVTSERRSSSRRFSRSAF